VGTVKNGRDPARGDHVRGPLLEHVHFFDDDLREGAERETARHDKVRDAESADYQIPHQIEDWGERRDALLDG